MVSNKAGRSRHRTATTHGTCAFTLLLAHLPGGETRCQNIRGGPGAIWTSGTARYLQYRCPKPTPNFDFQARHPPDRQTDFMFIDLGIPTRRSPHRRSSMPHRRSSMPDPRPPIARHVLTSLVGDVRFQMFQWPYQIPDFPFSS